MDSNSTIPKPALKPFARHILVCVKGRCAETGRSEQLFDTLRDRLAAAGLDEGARRVKRTKCQCFAICKEGPIVVVYPDGVWYCRVTSDALDRIVDEHLVGGRPVEELVFHRAADALCSLDREGPP
ncbi:MAG: (2Fe-2S) ferredoxin domain-containing protein [Nitrospirota bacterium]